MRDRTGLWLAEHGDTVFVLILAVMAVVVMVVLYAE